MSRYSSRPESPRLTLRQLEIFLAVAEHGGTAAAAGVLALSQSAVSAGLKTLEARYDRELFDRVGKRLLLNSTGRSIQSRARALLEDVQRLEADLLVAAPTGDLNLSASFTIANHVVVDYLTHWLECYPSARVDITPGNTPDVVARVLNRESELGLIENHATTAGIELIPWMDDELFVFAAAAHPLARKGRLQSRDLNKVNWILREPNSGARSLFDEVFADRLPELSVRMELSHNEPILRAVAQGLGVGCLSEKVLAPLVADGTFVPLRLPPNLRLQRKFYFCLRAQRNHRPEVMEFLRLCRDRPYQSVNAE